MVELETELEHHYRNIENYILKYSQGQQLTRFDNMNYRTAVREVNLHFAGEAFDRRDMESYRHYNEIAEKCNMQLRTLQTGRSKNRPSRRRSGEGLVDFKKVRHQIDFRIKKLTSIFN